jgi:hypothetical protein
MNRRAISFIVSSEQRSCAPHTWLARLGYLDARREPGKTRERTVYTLTEKGLDALRAYADTPAA